MFDFFIASFFGLEYGLAYPIAVTYYLLCFMVLFERNKFSFINFVRRMCEFICIFICYVIILSFFSQITEVHNSNLTLLVITAGYTIYRNRQMEITKWAISGIYLSAYLLIVVLSSTIAMQLREYKFLWVGKPEGFDITCITVLLFISVVVWYLKKYDIGGFRHVPSQYANMILLVSVFGILVFEIILSLEDISQMILFLFAIIFLSVEMMSYFLFFKVSSEYDEKMELLFMQQKVKTERENYELSISNYEEMRMLRHELKNYFTYSTSLLKQKRYDELEELFAGLNENELGSVNYIDCGNKVVSSVLNTMVSKGKKVGVRIVSTLMIAEELNIRDTELYSLLANLIENGIEASEGILDAQVLVDIRFYSECLYIKVINPIREFVELRPEGFQTTKKDKKIHGYGTKVIRMIVEKNDGYIHNKLEVGQLTTEVMLDLSINRNDYHSNKNTHVDSDQRMKEVSKKSVRKVSS